MPSLLHQISLAAFFCYFARACCGFSLPPKIVREKSQALVGNKPSSSLVQASSSNNNNTTSSFDDSDSASKGVVSSLTNLVNFFSFTKDEEVARSLETEAPPTSPGELLERIRSDYTDKNYLWTGDIDLASFDDQCRFTDPTLSFTGKDKFVKNIENLRPIVDALTEPNGCRSDLLDIQLVAEEGYIRTRWNMVGELNAIPWKPKIDVIGRTKFWYKQEDGCDNFRVVFYDEEWEIPAGKALLQLITPSGTIANSAS